MRPLSAKPSPPMAHGFAPTKMGSPDSNSILPKEIALHDPTSVRNLKAQQAAQRNHMTPPRECHQLALRTLSNMIILFPPINVIWRLSLRYIKKIISCQYPLKSTEREWMTNQSKLCVPNAGLGVGLARLVATVDMATRMPSKHASGSIWSSRANVTLGWMEKCF